jgi:hypothetical protein
MTAAAPPPPVQSEQFTPPIQSESYAPTPQPAAQPQYAPPVYPTPTQYASPSLGSPVVGTGAFLGFLILFCIPVVGWIACIIMAFASKNANIKHLARAVFILLIIGAILAVIVFFVLSWVAGAILEYLNEAYGDALGNAGSFADLFAALK